MHKKGAINLSVNVIVVTILAIVLLGLGLGFVKGMFGKTAMKFEEQISREPEPPNPTATNPISLSRENIKTNPEATEVVKISVLNPTSSDWVGRDFLYHGLTYPYVCGESDHVCYVNLPDCDGSTDPDCIDANKDACTDDGFCLVNEQTCPDIEDAIIRGEASPTEEFDLPDKDDCGPHDGVDLLVRCDNELEINKLSNPKIISAGDVQTFSIVLNIKRGIKGRYLCQITVFGNNAEGDLIQGFTEDLTIEV